MAEMTHPENVARLLAHWHRDQQISLGPPASESELNAFDRRYSVRLPPAMRAYLAHANGFGPLGNQDTEGFSFWPLQRITRVGDYRDGRYGDRNDIYLFADYLDWSWAYAVKLEGPLSSVFIVGTADGDPHMVSTSIDEFIEFYLADDVRIYLP